MPIFRQHRAGQDLGRGQRLAVATRVTLLEDNPENYDAESMQALANRPFSIEEWLLLSQDYLIYRTTTAVLEHLRQVLLKGARRMAPAAAQQIFELLADQLDPEETSVWLPLRGAHARPWVFEGRAPAMLGSRAVPFHYYEIQVADACLYFLQQPVGHRSAERDFERISGILRSGEG